MKPSYSTNPINVVIADKNKAFTDIFQALIKATEDIVVKEVCASMNDLMSLLKEPDMDVLLIDDLIFDKNPVESIMELSNQYLNIKIIGLSLFESKCKREDMIAAGAFEYISKLDSAGELLGAIRHK